MLVLAGILVDSLLDTYMANRYNEIRAEVAQSVEQRTENPRVPSSNLGLGTIIKRETGFPLKSKILAGV
jgi:hypothetical protein